MNDPDLRLSGLALWLLLICQAATLLSQPKQDISPARPRWQWSIQYRFYMTAAELEYQRRISDRMEFQLSLIPGVPLIVTFLFGVRFLL